MSQYIDAFVLPIPSKHINKYEKASQSIANIWKEHGALAYFEYIGDDLQQEGTKSFSEALSSRADETIIFGWVVFESLEKRNQANKLVAADSRMEALVAPLTDPQHIIFDAKKMIYGGFKALVQK